MDRLLVHQIVSGLSKFDSAATPPNEVRRLEALIDRLLTTAKDASTSLGQVLWYCVRSKATHQLADYLLNRLVEIENIHQNRFTVSSVVNYVHSSACTTALHLAAGFPNGEGHHLIELLLGLGADALRADVHGLVPLHLTIKQLKGKSGDVNGEMVEVIGLLLQTMVKQSKESTSVEEVLRKLAIIHAAIDANSALVLEVLDKTGVQLSRRLIFENLRYALQAEAGIEVTGHLLKMLKSCSDSSDEASLSPISLTLHYNNRRALLQAIKLGFPCSGRLFECGFLRLRPLFISERDREHFLVAKECFQHLIDQLLKHCSHDALANPATIRLLGEFTTRRHFFRMLHRPAEPEKFVYGNYLIYALLKHCGYMATILATLPLPVQFPVEGDVLLHNYRFSRHDVPVWKLLHRQNRLTSVFKVFKLTEYFRENCQPLYDARLTRDDIAANEEYALDQAAFEEFCAWLETEGNNAQGPRSLFALARNAFVDSLVVDADNFEVGSSGHEELERRCQKAALQCAHFQQLIGKSFFADLMRAE